MSNFMGVSIFWIGLNWADLGCWRLTLIPCTVYPLASLGLPLKFFHYDYDCFDVCSNSK